MKFIEKHLRLFDRILKYLFSAIFMAVVLYPKFPLISIPGTFVSIRLEDFLLFAVMVYVLTIYSKNIYELLKKPIFKMACFYLIFAGLSTLYGIYILQTVTPHIGLLHFIRRIEYFSPFLIGYIAVKRDKNNLQFFIKTIPIVYAYIFIYGLGQRYFSWPIIITQNLEYSKGVALRWMEGSHINSTFAGHYDMASFLVLTLPLTILVAIFVKKIKYKLIYLLSFLFGLWLLVNSASRISLVSYMCAAVISLIMTKKKKYILLVIIISILFSGFSPSLLERYQRFIEVAKLRTDKIIINISQESIVFASEDVEKYIGIKESFPTPTPIPKMEDRSTSIRLNVEWPRAIRAFLKNPAMGTGLSSITLATDNDYLRSLGESGIFGFLAFFMIIFILNKDLLLEYFRKRNFDIPGIMIPAFLGGTFGILINAAFIDIFEASKFAIVFWLIAGMLYATTNDEKNS